ncbi:MAG TPA: tripartite tricarboxylate transporter substrate binding protein [Burkholderiaceae bacterium]|nr:tripartite tricarboxylate transporter substrate binding protein [Burkholderiaceae bacterium]
MKRLLIPIVALCAATAASAQTQSWPNRPVRVIVPFTAGSGTDIAARAVTERLAVQTGQPFVVENRPGAGGTIGQAVVAKAEPDGYTILIHSSSQTVTPSTYQNLPFDTLRDFSGITMLANIPNVLVVAPNRGFKTVQDLVSEAKAKPNTLTYASAGMGSATHLNAERFRLGAGLVATHVPYKGTPEALTDVMGGRVDYYFCPVVNALPLLRDGKLVALAVGSSKRSSALPELPTTEEAGIPNSAYNFWVGMFAPSKTPREIVARLHAETVKALNSPEVKERYARLGAEFQIFTPEQFDDYLRKEVASNAQLVKAADIKVQ